MHKFQVISNIQHKQNLGYSASHKSKANNRNSKTPVGQQICRTLGQV
jgi:hypothetical protein